MGTPNHIQYTGHTISNAWVQRVESTDYPYKQILWKLSRESSRARSGVKSVEVRESKICLIVAPTKKNQRIQHVEVPSEEFKFNTFK